MLRLPLHQIISKYSWVKVSAILPTSACNIVGIRQRRKTERNDGMQRMDYFWTILLQINKRAASSVNGGCGCLDTKVMIAFYWISNSDVVNTAGKLQ